MKTTDLKTGADAARRGPSRRGAMKTIAGAAAALVAAPYIRPASAAPTELRASYAGDRAQRRLLRAGMRQQLRFSSARFCARQLQAGSRHIAGIMAESFIEPGR